MATRKEPKVPNGTPGVILSATNESQQEDLFFPSTPWLVAVNVNGDPTFGTIVFDINDANELDPDRGAHLQAALRVVKEPLGKENSLAFQLGPTGQNDAQCGWFTDIPDGNQRLGENIQVANGSWTFLGPLHVGHKDDKHFFANDADGHKLRPLHLWTGSLFYMDKIHDGPMLFEIEFKRGQDLRHPVKTHLAWSGADWQWYSSCAWYKPEKFPPDVPTVPVPPNTKLPPFGPPRKPPVPGDPPDFPPIEINPGGPFPKFNPPGSGDFGDPPKKIIPTSSLVETAMNLVAALTGVMVPAVAFRPQNYGANQIDSGLFNDANDETKQRQDSIAPIVGMFSAFGAQSGELFSYTQTPKGEQQAGKLTSKYLGGTASGGIVFHPPETDLRDLGSYDMSPPGVTLSTAYLMTSYGACFGAGIPMTATGGLKSGYSWGADTDNGDLVYSRHSATGVATTALTMAMDGSIVPGTGALGTAATGGWLYIASCPGTPTGTPATSYTGRAPLVFDTTNDKLYAYDGGWVNVTGPSGSGAAGQVAVWDGASSMTGHSKFTFDTANDLLTIDGSATARIKLNSSSGSDPFLLVQEAGGTAWGFGLDESASLFRFCPDDNLSAAPALSMSYNRDVIVGSTALSTGATNGFLYIPTMAGVPSGVPTDYDDTAAMVYDSANNNLYVYNGGWVKFCPCS